MPFPSFPPRCLAPGLPRTRLAALLLAGLVWTACASPEPSPTNPSPSAPEPGDGPGDGALAADPVGPRHAQGFSVEAGATGVRITVEAPWSFEPRSFWLVPRDATPPPSPDGSARVIRVPVERVATTSTTELPHLEALGASDRWVGHSGLQYVYSPVLRQRIDAGQVTQIGTPSALDVEQLLALAPEVLLVDLAADAQLADLELLERSGIVVVPMPAYLETTALARAEWLLLTGHLLGEVRAARQVFAGIEERYLDLRARVSAAIEDPGLTRPTVLLGAPWNDVWWMPPGGTWAAGLLADAGGAYLWADEPGKGGNLPLSLETVVERALDADVWLHPSHWRSLDEVASADSRLTGFSAYGRGSVWAHDRRRNEHGDDYFESGILWPDRLLADLVWIFHPELLPDHEPYYYRRLVDSAGAPESPPPP